MPIKNYTTQISADKTIMEIERSLVNHGAQMVLKEYDPQGVVSHVSFKIPVNGELVPFRLPCNTDGILRCLETSPKVPRRLRTREQAARVGWRVVKDWIQAQLAIVDAEMAAMEETFLPYAQLSDGRTLYEKFSGGPALMLQNH